MDGLEVIRRLREWSAVPIIVLSARGQERDKIEALDAGADDYLDQAVRRRRAAGAHARRAAPRRRAADERRRAVVRRRATCGSTSRARQVAVGARPRSTSRRSSTGCSRRWCATPGRSLTHRQLLQRGLGAGVRRADALPARLHGASCATSSRPTRRGRATLTEPGVGYRLLDGVRPAAPGAVGSPRRVARIPAAALNRDPRRPWPGP